MKEHSSSTSHVWSVPDAPCFDPKKLIRSFAEAVFRADGMVVVHLQSRGLMDVVRISNTLHLSDLLWENPKEWRTIYVDFEDSCRRFGRFWNDSLS